MTSLSDIEIEIYSHCYIAVHGMKFLSLPEVSHCRREYCGCLWFCTFFFSVLQVLSLCPSYRCEHHSYEIDSKSNGTWHFYGGRISLESCFISASQHGVNFPWDKVISVSSRASKFLIHLCWTLL